MRHCRARYYHPGRQRFISEDPIEFAGGNTNLYAYVSNSPASLTDPTGEIPTAVIGAALGAAVGGLRAVCAGCGTYDGQGNVASVTRLNGTPAAVTTSFTYETPGTGAFNRLTSLTAPIATTTLAYDNTAQTITLTDPLSHATVITHTPKGQWRPSPTRWGTRPRSATTR